MKISEAFAKVDDFGVFQKFIMGILAISGFFHGMQTSSSNFISGRPEQWCLVRQLENFSFDQQRGIAIPSNSEGNYEPCLVFDVDWDNYTTDDFLTWNRTVIEDTFGTVNCDEFIYSKEIFLDTANSKWDLLCTNSVLAEMISTVYVVGLFLGSISSGRVSDAIGRRYSEMGFCVILMVALFAAAFVPDVIAFMVLRFIVGFAMRGANISASVLMMELSGPKQRELAGVLVPGFFAIGVMVCSGCAFLLRDFQLLHIVMGGIATSLLLSLVVIPESPRWLLASGKLKQAENLMRYIGSVNNRPLPEDFTLKEKSAGPEKKMKASYISLFHYPILRKHILIMHFLWVAANFSHMAMTLNLGVLTGNAYLNVFVSGLTELPANLMVMFSMRRLGRKRSFMIFGTVFFLCNGIAVPFELIPHLNIAASISTIIARATAGAMLSSLRVLTVELFPTLVRQRVLGAMTGLAAAVGISGSYIGGSLRDVWRPLPNMIFGSLGFVGVILAAFLPETIGCGLPETMEDAMAVGTKRSRTLTGESVPSISESVHMQNGKLQNGIANVIPIEKSCDDSLDDDIMVFHL